ncbi:MAG TPA: T9SS type A sorting domain-containing protein [Chitinophagaceae bacterium]|nr:T9SS type A sorting domain-containing protein [Chitinophagaceae bacterium]
MKPKLTQAIGCICVAAALLMQPCAAAARTTEDPKSKKEVKKAKVPSSRNNSSVRIYPDILKRVMHVVARDNEETVDFFVFDLEGTLIQHYKMKPGEHQKLADLKRGMYVFSVFSGDEETATGNIEIR